MTSRREARVGVLGLAFAAFCLVSAPAEGQLDSSFYVVTNAPGTYATLGSAGNTVTKVTGTDQGAYDLSLSGWSFPYFDQKYGDIWITADGFLSMQDSTHAPQECGCISSNGCEWFQRFCGGAGGNCGGGCCIQANGTCGPGQQPPGCGSSSIGCCGNGGSTCLSDREDQGYQGPPSTTFPTKFGGVIAPYWKGLDDTPNHGIRYLAGGTAGAHTLTVDYPGVWDSNGENLDYYVGGQYSFSVTLFESGMIEVDYGPGGPVYSALYPKGAAEEFYEAWALISSPDQASIVNGLPCMAEPNWATDPDTGVTYCAADWRVGCGCTPERFPANQTIFYGQPAGVAFYPQLVTASNGFEDPVSQTLEFDVATLALNIGRSNLSAPFTDNLYLEKGLQPTDKLGVTCASLGAPGCVYIGSQSTKILAAPALAQPLTAKHVSIPLPGDGLYTLEEWLDPTNRTANGLAGRVGVTSLAVGWDLTGSIGVDPPGIPGPSGPCMLPEVAGPGSGQSIPVTFRNLGTRSAPDASYRLWLSKTNTLPFDASATSPNIVLAPDGKVSLAGFATQGPECLPITVPSIPEGDYYFVLQMDPDGAYAADVNPANNIVFSNQTVRVSPPHLRVSEVVGPKDCFQGRVTDIGFTLANDGAFDALGFSIGLMFVPQDGALTTTSYEVARIDAVSLKAACTVEVRHGAVVFSSSDGCYTWPAGALQEVAPPNGFDPRKQPPGTYYAGVIADITNLVLPPLGRDTNHLEASTITVCQLPLPDFSIVAAGLSAPTSVLAGSQVLVERNIRNVGVSSASATYEYFLNLNASPEVLELNQGGIPIPVVLPTGGLAYSQTVTLDYPGNGQSEDRGADILVIPSSLAPPAGARYTLALVLDPKNQVAELDKSNNVAGAGPITVTQSDLAIESVNPPPALPNVPYSFTFSATGGFGDYSWSLLAGSLPAGMTLTPDGTLSGTATTVGNWKLLLQVSSGGESSGGETQVASVTFTVSPPSGPLQVIKSGLELPPATVGKVYAAQLAAEGGTPPYGWVAAQSSLPDGLNLSLSGLLSGTPTPRALTPKGAAALAVTVTDQAGNTTSDTYLLEIVGPGDLVIMTTDIPNQQVSVPWEIDLSANGCRGSEPSSPWCHWTTPEGQLLPAGLTLATEGKGASAVGHLSGTLSQSGIWFFEVQVTDDSAHVAKRHYRLEVGGSTLTLPNQTLGPATAGQPYSAQLTGPSGVTVTWLLYSGDLPPGLSLGSDGSISGTVDANAGVRTYAFAVSAQDRQGDSSLLAQAITVRRAATTHKAGCSTGGGGLTPFGALVLLLARRRNTPAPA